MYMSTVSAVVRLGVYSKSSNRHLVYLSTPLATLCVSAVLAVVVCLSVSPSVRVGHSCIASTGLKISSNCFLAW